MSKPSCPLAGRTAVVTGASSGIGQAVALRLAAEGATVNALGRDKVRLDKLLESASGNGEILTAQVDLSDDDARGDFVTGLLAGPRVDILVHSAGSYTSGNHDEATPGDLDSLYASNVRGPYALTRELLPALRAAGGDIVVMNSTQGVQASGGVGQYAATQHAMRAITDSLRQELNADGIRVCGIYLGRTATPRQEAIFANEGRPYAPELLIQPKDVAEVVMAILTLPTNAEVTEIRLRPARKSY